VPNSDVPRRVIVPASCSDSTVRYVSIHSVTSAGSEGSESSASKDMEGNEMMRRSSLAAPSSLHTRRTASSVCAEREVVEAPGR